MFYLDLTLASPAENLALDEALLDQAEGHGGPAVLRVWESPVPFVVLGLGGKAADDVDAGACAADRIPVRRRTSGGGTVLQGPGCLSYALVLPFSCDPALAGIRSTNDYVLTRVASAVRTWAPEAAPQGISDIAVGVRKISGNAQRRKKQWLLFHGTLLYAFDAARAARYLRPPARQPEYRAQRSHEDFLTNLAATPDELKAALRSVWDAGELMAEWPRERTVELAVEIESRG